MSMIFIQTVILIPVLFINIWKNKMSTMNVAESTSLKKQNDVLMPLTKRN